MRETILKNLREFSTPQRPIYLVGGAVRDWILDRPVHDLDFVLPGETRRLAQEIASRFEGALFILDEKRQTTRVVLNQAKLPGGHPGERLLLDFAAFQASDLQEDLSVRDFTINAMAVDVAHPDQLIDPTGGLADLQDKRIRACSPNSLNHDPVRVLRAVRQALGLGFRIEPETLRLMRSATGLLPRVSAERLWDELFKMLDGPQVALSIRLLDQVGALAYILPELEELKGVGQSAPHIEDVWEHTLSAVQHLERLLAPLVGQYRQETVADLSVVSAVLWLGRFRDHFFEHFQLTLVPERTLRSLLFLAALYHDIEKPASREVMPEGKIRFLGHPEKGAQTITERGLRLALSTHEIARLETIIRHHMRVHFMANSLLAGKEKMPSRRVIYRFFKDTGVSGVDICLLSLADTRGTFGVTLPQETWQSELEICRLLLEAYWEKTEEVVSPPRLLSGNDLIKLYGMEPGKEIGRILGALREGQAAGEIVSREEALEFTRHWVNKTLDPGERSEEPDYKGQEGYG
ncbi:MAG: CCA tRNA nucleotidyltransferase [Anaerolineaceae bacterium]|nr:CCA tRNA nucleotidyltransferase [Anaerolineaceae bacterium]